MQGATQTASLGKFSCLYYSGLLMASSFSSNIDFMAMILFGDELTAKLRHTGNIVVSVETSNSRGERVLQGTAEVAQRSSTFYVVTGQGSQESSMGMLLRALLGKAQIDAHLTALSSRWSSATQRRRRSISEELKVKPSANAT